MSDATRYLSDIAAFALALGVGGIVGQPMLGAAFAAGLLWRDITHWQTQKGPDAMSGPHLSPPLTHSPSRERGAVLTEYTAVPKGWTQKNSLPSAGQQIIAKGGQVSDEEKAIISRGD